MNISESISLAFNSFSQYKLRASLTLLSISIGVFAIMGAGTLIYSIDHTVTDELSQLGENSFIFMRMPAIRTGHDWRKFRKRKPITYSQYIELKKSAVIPETISASSSTGGLTVKTTSMSTDPDVSLIGSDETYFITNNQDVIEGRPITEEDLTLNRNVAVIGNDVLIKIFPHESSLGKKIRIRNQSFTVVGVLQPKGAIFGESQDNRVIVPLPQFLKYYASWWQESLTIIIRAPSSQALVPAMDECIGLMRTLRNVKPWEDNSFEIETNESITEQFSAFTGFLAAFGFISGFIALIAAGVGITNIMLVSVKERTREIGVRKAVGAKRRWILIQFIIETVTLCQVGGLIGILLGLLGAFLLGLLISINIVFPMFWFVASIIICTVLGVISGAYPAWKASSLDPIDALRYE